MISTRVPAAVCAAALFIAIPVELAAQTPVGYRVLATTKTSTMQKEMQEAGDAGFEYRGQTAFKSAFGGKEVVVILERPAGNGPTARFEYRLLAAKRTSTLQKELSEAGDASFEFVGMTVAKTAVGGEEVVAILRRKL